MDDLCSICMCNGRKLYFMGETGFYILYKQILSEIPVYDLSQIPVRICWECRTLLFRFHKFKSQVKQSYMSLLKHSKELTTPKPSQPHLQIQLVTHITYPELKVKTEKEEEVAEDPEDSEVTSGQGHVQLEVQVEGHAEVKSEQETEHCEPETFVNNLDLERPRRKRAAKVPRNEKPNKEKPKKKLKETKKSKFKKKSRVESRKRRVSTDTSVSDVSFGQSVMSDTREEVTNSQTDVTNSQMDVTNIQTDEIVKDEVSLEAVPKVNGKVDKAPRKVKQSSKDELPEKPQCVECGKMFSSRKTYRYHLNVLHKGQNRYPCPRCGKVYQWKSNLGRHMRTHKARDSGELYCETCDKRFASVATYRQHLRVSRRHVSESEFSFMCNECGKKFVSKTRLRDHIDWEHLNNIKFRCQLCNKPFKCHTSLYVHMQNVHRNKEKKDNLCHVCGKSYQNAAKLKYHIVAMHTSETPYQCTQCTAAFGWYSSLYRHVREVHYKMKVQPKKAKKVKKLGSEILPSLVPQPPLLNMQPGPS